MLKEIVWGCASDGRPLLTRYHLLRTPWFRLYLHVFHRSDIDRSLHDHPWDFLSLILWGGYTEVRPIDVQREALREGHISQPIEMERMPYFPGALLYRPAWWAHRIELEPGKKSISLVLVGRKSRDWGFFSKQWTPWKEFVNSSECG